MKGVFHKRTTTNRVKTTMNRSHFSVQNSYTCLFMIFTFEFSYLNVNKKNNFINTIWFDTFLPSLMTAGKSPPSPPVRDNPWLSIRPQVPFHSCSVMKCLDSHSLILPHGNFVHKANMWNLNHKWFWYSLAFYSNIFKKALYI